MDGSTNLERFEALRYHWETVKLGFLRELDAPIKMELESIYKSELDPTFIPNRYCKACYFKAIEELINHFGL